MAQVRRLPDMGPMGVARSFPAEALRVPFSGNSLPAVAMKAPLGMLETAID